MVWVFTYSVLRVGVVGVLPGWNWDCVRGDSCVSVFIVGLYCVNDYLGVGCYFVGNRIADGGKVGLVLGPGLEVGCSFKIVVVAFWALFI